jgi:hypothetical protein
MRRCLTALEPRIGQLPSALIAELDQALRVHLSL